MAQTLTSRVKAIKNTPGTGEAVQIIEINDAFDKFDNHFTPACLLRAASQSVPHNTTTDIDFNNTTFDTYAARGEGPMADLALNRIVIRRAGVYLFTAQGGFVANATGGRRLAIDINGTQIASDEHPGAATGVVCTVSVPFVCAVNDIIKLRISQTSGGALATDVNISTNGLHLSALWQGAAVEV